MQVTKEILSPTKFKLSVSADQALLDSTKQEVLTHLSRKHVKVQGFRSGKAPLSLIEKQADPNLLQSEFLETAINRLYGDALTELNLRPVAQPDVQIQKFVPYTTLEFTAEVESVGTVKLPDYKKIKVQKPTVSISAKDVNEVLDSLRTRAADKADVDRAAKAGDQVFIDFLGVDTKTGDPISGADGTDYPLLLGSNSFIPGFEDNLTGMKSGDEKTFELTFPKDYGVATLQNRKVSFATTLKKVQAVTPPKLDDAFAATVGPFKTLAELKADIKKQLTTERQANAERDYESIVLEAVATKATVAIPDVLIEEEIDRQEDQERQNLVYRGQTWQEHLEAEGVTAEEHRERMRDGATMRVKAGLVLSEIADAERILITPEELEIRLQLMKGQYQDPAMLGELEKPETRREVASRLLSEKTIQKLTDYASA